MVTVLLAPSISKKRKVELSVVVENRLSSSDYSGEIETLNDRLRNTEKFLGVLTERLFEKGLIDIDLINENLPNDFYYKIEKVVK